MTRSIKLLALPVALLALALSARPARADDAGELERAKASYDAGRYGEGVDRFRQLLNADSPDALHDPVAIERARAYYAACLIALDRNAEADTQIEAIIRADPLYTPDSVVFPGKVVNRMLDVKAHLKVEIEKQVQQKDEAQREQKRNQEREQQAYIDELQKLAGQETVVVRHSRWIAALPFGVGQFQNGQETLGYTFLASEAALAAASLVSGVIHMELVAQYSQYTTAQRSAVDFPDFKSRKEAAQAISIYSTVGLGLVALGGILQAELEFVPELHETRPRPLPKAPAITPMAFGTGTGFSLGVAGRF
jgi:tetratricopeptide (TPR) repeat protein